MRVPKRRSEQNRRFGPPDDHLSDEALERLRTDLRRLEEAARPKAVADLAAAREMGDLSENAAYTEAKARLRGIDGRIMSIKERLKRAVPIERGAAPDGSARIGSTVVVEVAGKRRTFLITGSQEADPSSGRISHASPVGSALMGRKPGDETTVLVDGRHVVYRVISVQ